MKCFTALIPLNSVLDVRGFYFLIIWNLLLHTAYCRSINISLPIIPDVVQPPIPIGFNVEEDAEIILDAEQDPEVRPGLFQGDMALNNEIYNYWRVGLRWDIFPEKLWKNRTVPYVISPLYGNNPTNITVDTATRFIHMHDISHILTFEGQILVIRETEHYITIYHAIQTLNFMTCVKFVPWDGKAKDYLLIWPVKYPSGCWSYVGRYGGPQILSLQPPDDRSSNCLGSEGRALHELLHALGIFHEQSRADRDKFVKVHLDNVIPQYKVNFDKQSLENTTYTFEYDYDSIMHYGRTFFSISKSKPTISVKTHGKTIGQRKMLSKTDCLKVNDLYGCLGTPPLYRKKFYILCEFMGI